MCPLLRLPRYGAVYALCREFGLAIIEDDPYFYLQHNASGHASSHASSHASDHASGHASGGAGLTAGATAGASGEESSRGEPSTGEPSGGKEGSGGGKEANSDLNSSAWLRSLGPSFLSLDVDGRVLRLDSFSKVGRRLNYHMGPPNPT